MKNLTKVPCKRYRLKKWVKHLLATLSAILFTSIIALNLLPKVAVQRGYFALGGEWFLLIALSYSIYVVVDVVIDVYFV